MKVRLAGGIAAIVLLTAVPAAAQESPDSLALGRKFTGWFFDGASDSLWSVMDSAMQGRVGSIESIENMMDQVADQIGEEVELVSESSKVRDDGVREYRRLAEFDMAPERVVWIWRINAEGKLVGAQIRPESQAPPE